MAAKELGQKWTCFKCGTKFYDLKKPEPLCPKCGSDQRESPALRPPPEKRQRAPARPPAPVATEPVEELEADAGDLDDDLEGDEDGDEAADDEADEP
jgi:hypothetical protein